MASGSHWSGPGAFLRIAVRHRRSRWAVRGWRAGETAAGDPARAASAGLIRSPKWAWNCAQRCS
eukprot:8669678-Alexandrium_andersonii.AAC.1